MSLYKPTYTDKQTGEKRKSNVWWYNFTYAGRHVQESAKTSKKTLARVAEQNRRDELERASVGLPSKPAGERIRRLSDVLKEYEQGYAVNHKKKSLATVRERLAPCGGF